MNDPVATAPISPLRQRLIDDMNMRQSIPPVLVCVVAPRLSTRKSKASAASQLWSCTRDSRRGWLKRISSLIEQPPD